MLSHDPDGSWSAKVQGTAAVAFDSSPPGAAVSLFRYQERGDVIAGQRRMLAAVPMVDLTQTDTLPDTAPEGPGPLSSCLLGTTPLPPTQLLPDWYVAWMEAPGHAPQAVPFHVDHAVESYSKPIRLAPRLVALTSWSLASSALQQTRSLGANGPSGCSGEK
ncbi:MAG: hypothetical protein ACI9EF_003463 [Pseudohongiellaceae bacterium]